MKRALALGGAGFIGSYVVRELLAHDWSVTVVDDFSKYGPVEHDFFGHPSFRMIEMDCRALPPEEYAEHDVVLCLAARIGGIRYFNSIPYTIARDNSEILFRAIDATLSAAETRTFVYFSSSMVYERLDRPVTEADALNQLVPLTSYGMQKLFGEVTVRAAHAERALEYLIVRPFNAVGAGELPDTKQFGMAHVIPDFAYKALVKESPFSIIGDGQQVRTFTHALDVARAVRLLLDSEIRNDDFDLCGDATVRIDELARRVWQAVNPALPFPGFAHQPAPPADVRYRVGKGEKARRALGWTPTRDLDAIIADCVAYVRARSLVTA